MTHDRRAGSAGPGGQRLPFEAAAMQQESTLMTETRRPVTGKIIEAFSAGLSDTARAQISSAQLA
jgi:hypothetical protein